MPHIRLHRRPAALALALVLSLVALGAREANARSRVRTYERRGRWSYVFQAGANTHLQYFAGIAQLALLRNYAREHWGLVQFAFFSNRGKRALSLLQFAGWNAMREGYFLVQAGGLNQFRQLISAVQIGGLNEARFFAGALQAGVVNDVGDIGAIAQVAAVNLIDDDAYMGLQVGGLNFVQGSSSELWTLAQVGLANVFDKGAELYALLQLGLYNSGDDDISVILAQIGVVNRMTEGTFRGLLQIGAAMNVGENITGVAVAPYNYVGDRLYGAQIGVVNLAREVNGTQIGLFNYARTLHGVQLGLINISRHGGLPFCVIGNIGF
ncbi:MAG: hypothetical protein KC503_08925 [Myxococcales bacterium]|nr:hypothetical protein [Myxococcales bacterium]